MTARPNSPAKRPNRPILIPAAVVLSTFLLACGDPKAPPPSGAIHYRQYCASCHGLTGQGDGPLAASLQTDPSDLTTLARRAGGSFDEAAVMRAIDGRRDVAAHGPREMPVWGAVFTEELEGEAYAPYVVLLRSRALTDYLRSIQVE